MHWREFDLQVEKPQLQIATVFKGDNATSQEDQQTLLLKRIRELETESDILNKL
jgi:hypothetical protein